MPTANDHGYVPLVVNISRSFPDSLLITGFVTRLTRRVSLVEQELITLPEHMSSPTVFKWGSCYSIFSFMCMFCRLLFVILSSFLWPLCCLSFFGLRILITPLISSSSFHTSSSIFKRVPKIVCASPSMVKSTNIKLVYAASRLSTWYYGV